MTIVPGMPVWWSSDTDEENGNGICTFRTINKGTFTGPLNQLPPTGKGFEFRGVIDMVIEGGLIKELNEWYTQVPFSHSKPVEEYHTLTGDEL